MDLFAITCTTCKSRLRVRDPAAVGQILACPKCGGMVMVKPPPAWQEAGEQKSDLPTAADVEGPRVRFDQTANDSAFDVLEELLSDAPPKVQPPTAAVSGGPGYASQNPATPSQNPATQQATTKPRFVGGPPAKRSATPPPAAAKPSFTPESASRIPPPVKTASPAAPSTISGSSRPAADPKTATPPASDPAAPLAKAPRKSWLLTAASIAVGTLLAFTAVTAAIHFIRPAAVGRPIPPRPSKTNRTAGPIVAEAGATESVAQTAVAANDSVQPITEAAASAESVASSIPPVSPPSPPTASDPLGLVKQAPAVAATPPSTSDPLARFDRILGGATDDPLSKSTAKNANTVSLPPADSGPPKPIAPRPAPREIDVAKRLADPLPGVETAPAGTPLAEFVQILSDLSTIPITLDVPFVPVTAESTVSLRMTNATVGSAVTEALKSLPARLEYVIDNDQLVIRRAEPAKPAPFPISLKSLAGDEQQMNELADLITAVVEPATWGEADNAGSVAIDAAKGALLVTNRRGVQFQALLAVEKLRAARTPPLKHESTLDPALFKLDTRTALAKPRLEKSVSLNYSQPTRLLTILERLRGATGVRILVDWRDVAAAGWNPAGEATLVVRNEPLSATLDALLTPLDLTWRVIDGQTVQVITPARLREQGELEFYKVEDLLTGGQNSDDIIAKIRSALGDAAFTSGGGTGEIRFDDGSKCLLAWLPQPKQRELESLLAKWRGEKAG